uniref:Putative fasciclin-like arabinogalactan protein 8 n=1 Tax=Davidia involucrata TaxID=16924 RepID=A0A5B7AIQ6_DAVIN
MQIIKDAFQFVCRSSQCKENFMDDRQPSQLTTSQKSSSTSQTTASSTTTSTQTRLTDEINSPNSQQCHHVRTRSETPPLRHQELVFPSCPFGLLRFPNEL